MIDTAITYGNTKAKVSPYGALIVSPVDYSKAAVDTLIADDTGVAFIEPRSGKQIVITQITMFADKSVSATIEADIVIYESTTGIGQTVADSILEWGLIKQGSEVFPMNYITEEGRWVMAKSSDSSIKISIFYYYV